LVANQSGTPLLNADRSAARSRSREDELAISAAAGLGIPVLWEIIKFFALFFGVLGQLLISIAGALSLYILCFPGY
jgi:hypothetical protein